ncbi:urea transport system permease protein [Azospirillum fermentarium]|uniref:urea ABC transporter permease subunit UrtB n=1 Tax=Azospirillum fermentarium TaxID=1233114 RepID=UPI0022270C07|nr:urea ABC transporter permease subunit UrtB [Azospirillum fermentarium]MCW2248015.1 urea transport system permease protein [Azospirillum fermentarium]
MRCVRLLQVLFVLLALGAGTPARAADDSTFSSALAGLAADGFAEKIAAAERLAGTGDARALAVLRAMESGSLFVRKSDGAVLIGAVTGREAALTDPLTGADAGTSPTRDLTKITVNNALRSALAGLAARLDLASPDPARRLAAAQAAANDPSPEAVALLKGALARETDAGVKAALSAAVARSALASPDAAERLQAVADLSGILSAEVRFLVAPLANDPDPAVRQAVKDLTASIERRETAVAVTLNLFQGVSLGSVLLLAAVGLAITFGVMGVINMAHGEMIMLGAYTTFVVQEAFRAWLPPSVFGLYLILAIPAAFLVAGAVGVALERGVIRFLYGRPLETMLATWGISLALQQMVRSLFGATNKEVANPAWMTGAWEAVPGLVLTWNRIAIVIFALAVLAAVAAALRYTSFGLRMRAVTQNRPMAACMGIKTGWVDALTFGLGSGIAGVAGVALSQVGNVSPNLGQTYIVDSFMVVVFGGVGSLWGVLAGAMSLGVVNKVLEPYAGAMLGKILVLVFIILFIQKRPRGLFALKGRAAEA